MAPEMLQLSQEWLLLQNGSCPPSLLWRVSHSPSGGLGSLNKAARQALWLPSPHLAPLPGALHIENDFLTGHSQLGCAKVLFGGCRPIVIQ